MPGTWTQDLVGAPSTRPGFYANFQATALAAVSGVGQGVVLIGGSADWGTPLAAGVNPVDFTSVAQVDAEFGLDLSLATSQPAKRACKMALDAGAPMVRFVMLATGSAAKAARILVDTAGTPANVLTLTARKSGARGNEFNVSVAVNAADATMRDIKLYEQTTLLRTWTSTVASGSAGHVANLAAIINADTQNLWIDATVQNNGGNNTLAIITTQALTAGNSGAVLTATQYTNALDIIETVEFNELVFASLTDGSIQTSIASWIKSVRNAGKKIYVTFGGADAETPSAAGTAAFGFNDEGIRYHWPGIEYLGTYYNGANSCAAVAGRIASRDVPVGLTFDLFTFSKGVTQKTSDANVKAMLAKGVFVLTAPRGVPRVEKDINTLTTYTTGKNELYSSIRVMRELDGLFTGLQIATDDNYIGKINNDEAGQSSLMGAYRSYIDTLVTAGWFKSNYIVQLGTAQASVRDRVFIEVGVTPIDAIKYVFTKISVS